MNGWPAVLVTSFVAVVVDAVVVDLVVDHCRQWVLDSEESPFEH